MGDYWHGNPNLFNTNHINKNVNKTFGKLYNETLKKLEKLKSLGYNIKYIWENDWKNFKKKSVQYPNIQTY